MFPDPGPAPLTLAYTKQKLIRVLQHIAERDGFIPQSRRWLELLKDNPEYQQVFLRYGGMKTKSPWTRHRNALKSSVQGPIKRIYDTTTLLFSEVMTNITIFTLSRATVTFSADTTLLSIREQALISLLGHDTLLNIQSGGTDDECMISREDAYEYEKLKFSTVAAYRANTVMPFVASLEAISECTWEVQRYANQNPFSTGTNHHTFTNTYRTLVYEQAMPVVTKQHGYTPLVTIGHDPTYQTFRSNTSLYKANILTRRNWEKLINPFTSLEHASGSMTKRKLGVFTKPKCCSLLISFNDQRNHEKTTKSYQTSSRVSLCCKPIVGITWGEDVSSPTKSSWPWNPFLKYLT